MTGFEYFHENPVERFRVPDQTDPLTAGALLLAFLAYPRLELLRKRQEATDAYRAWLFRAALSQGAKVKPPKHLTRDHLDPRLMRRRVYQAAMRVERHALDLVGMAMDMTFFRSDGPAKIASLMGAAFGAQEVSVHTPTGAASDVEFLKAHLSLRKSTRAMDEDHVDGTVRDFRRRFWKVYLPALPLLTAIHVDCLKYDFHRKKYGVAIPGFPKRYLAISLLMNSELWIPSVILNARVRRAGMLAHFPLNTFPEILGEQGTPSWLEQYEGVGCQKLPPADGASSR